MSAPSPARRVSLPGGAGGHAPHGGAAPEATPEELAAAEEAAAAAADMRAMVAFLRRAVRVKGYVASMWTDEHDAQAEQFLALPELRVLVAYVSAGTAPAGEPGAPELVLVAPHAGAGLPVAPRGFAYFVKKPPPSPRPWTRRRRPWRPR